MRNLAFRTFFFYYKKKSKPENRRARRIFALGLAYGAINRQHSALNFLG
jgi:hypothetical protein